MLRMIVSGGQTGVDRGALDAAIERGMQHGGWCPGGRRAEDGVIPSRYALRENDSRRYAARTERNVRNSDGTLVLYEREAIGGTRLTMRLARQLSKPLLAIDLERPTDVQAAVDWIRAENVEVLNVGGPRESQSPGIERRAAEFVTILIERLRSAQ